MTKVFFPILFLFTLFIFTEICFGASTQGQVGSLVCKGRFETAKLPTRSGDSMDVFISGVTGPTVRGHISWDSERVFSFHPAFFKIGKYGPEFGGYREALSGLQNDSRYVNNKVFLFNINPSYSEFTAIVNLDSKLNPINATLLFVDGSFSLCD